MRHSVREWGLLILFFFILILGRAFTWQSVKADGHSMDPVLADGERLIILSTTSIDRFDTVITRETEDGKTKEIVECVIGMPGDTITHENDVLYVNGKKIDEDYLDGYRKAFEDDQLRDTYSYNILFQELAESSDTFATDSDGNTGFIIKIPEGQYYLFGGDRVVSKDSREVGAFSKSDVVSKIKFRFWPLSKIGFIN